MFLTEKRLNQQSKGENSFTSKENSTKNLAFPKNSLRLEPFTEDTECKNVFLCTHRPARRQPHWNQQGQSWIVFITLCFASKFLLKMKHNI